MVLLYVVTPFTVTIKYYWASFCAVVCEKHISGCSIKPLRGKIRPFCCYSSPNCAVEHEEKPSLPPAILLAPGCDYICFKFFPICEKQKTTFRYCKCRERIFKANLACLSLLSLLPLLYSWVTGLCSRLLLLHGKKSIYSFCTRDLLGNIYWKFDFVLSVAIP